MKLFDPDPTLRWLFCMTHPDDEISICAWIRRLAAAGAHVSMCWTHTAPHRESEARAVADLLGVPAQNLTFLGAPDGTVCNHLAELLPLMRTAVAKARPDRVVCGAFEQGHLDHDSTNWLVHRAWNGLVLEVPFYHSYHTRLQTMNCFRPGPKRGVSAAVTGRVALQAPRRAANIPRRTSGLYCCGTRSGRRSASARHDCPRGSVCACKRTRISRFPIATQVGGEGARDAGLEAVGEGGRVCGSGHRRRLVGGANHPSNMNR